MGIDGIAYRSYSNSCICKHLRAKCPTSGELERARERLCGASEGTKRQQANDRNDGSSGLHVDSPKSRS